MTYGKSALYESNENGKDPVVENNTDKLSNKSIDDNSKLFFFLISKLKLYNLLSRVDLSMVNLFDKLNLTLLVQDITWIKNSVMIVKT